MIEIVKEPEWLPTTCVDHRFTTHPLAETTFTVVYRYVVTTAYHENLLVVRPLIRNVLFFYSLLHHHFVFDNPY